MIRPVKAERGCKRYRCLMKKLMRFCQWLRAIGQVCLGIIGIVLFFIAVPVSLVGSRIIAHSTSSDVRTAEVTDGTDVTDRTAPALTFKVEFRPSHLFLAEYDKCIVFQSGKRIGVWMDTGGKVWEQTKRNGVGAVAFKGIENGTLFAADPDCAGLASEGAIPWEKNRQWIDLLSRSGMPFFISWRRTLADGEVRGTLAAAFRRAAQSRATAEAQDWFETPVPVRWTTADGPHAYEW